MPTTKPRGSTTFDENLDALYEELSLAAKWGRPSILLAVNKSKPGQDKAEQVLEARLKTDGKPVSRIVVNNERADVPHLIAAAPAADQTIFFVSNIDWGGGEEGKDAYRALNLHRELFVEKRIKAVFWLTTSEAANLPRWAPDFWAFRHRVIEFASARAARKEDLPAGVLLWDIQDSVDPFDSLEARIEAREAILEKLPHNREALSTRVDLLYTLGHLYWLAGNASKASAALSAGLELAKEHQLPEMSGRLLNGMGILQHESNEYEQAVTTYQEGLEKAPPASALLINLSAACCMLGKNQEAVTIGKRALRLNPADPRIWNRLGYIYAAMGKLDEAISHFRKAAEIAPRNPAYHNSLAVAYSLIERPDQARNELQTSRQLRGKRPAPQLDIYEEAILGQQAKAEELLRAALSAKRIQRYEARRDPNLGLLFGAAQIEALTS